MTHNEYSCKLSCLYHKVNDSAVSCATTGVVIDAEKVKVTFEKQGFVQVTDPCFVNTEHGNCIITNTGEKRKHLGKSDDSSDAVGSTYDVKHDHTYCVSCPRRLKRKYDNLLNITENLQKRLKTSHKKAQKLRRKVDCLTSVVSELQKEKLISSDCASILETTFSEVPRELMKRLVTQTQKKNPGAYPKQLRSFSMTLKFYSAKAYKFV